MSIYFSLFGTAALRMLSIHGPNISIPLLKKTIFEICSCTIGSRSWNKCPFDIVIVNPDTNTVYPDDHLISAYSSVLARRVPLDSDEASKMRRESKDELVNQPAAGHSSNSNRNTNRHKPLPSPVPRPTMEFVDLTTMKGSEEERIALMMHLSTEQFSPKYYITPNPLPMHNSALVSRCSHCRNEGHWHRNCPLKKIPRANGIPAHRLQVVDDPFLPGVLFNGKGKLVIVKNENDLSISAPRTAAPALRTSPLAPALTSATAAPAPPTAAPAPALQTASSDSIPRSALPAPFPPTAALVPEGLTCGNCCQRLFLKDHSTTLCCSMSICGQCISSHQCNRAFSGQANPDFFSSPTSLSIEDGKWMTVTQSISVIGSIRVDHRIRHSPRRARMTCSSRDSSSSCEETDFENQRRRSDDWGSYRNSRDHQTTSSYGQSTYPEVESRHRSTHHRHSPYRRNLSPSRTRSGSFYSQDSSRRRYESSSHHSARRN